MNKNSSTSFWYFFFLFYFLVIQKAFRGSSVVAVCMYIVAQGQLLFMTVVIQSRWERKKNLKGDGTKVWQDVLAYSECVCVCTYIGGGILYMVWCTIYIHYLSTVIVSGQSSHGNSRRKRKRCARNISKKGSSSSFLILSDVFFFRGWVVVSLSFFNGSLQQRAVLFMPSCALE